MRFATLAMRADARLDDGGVRGFADGDCGLFGGRAGGAG